jgi:hypothetical protein
MKKLLPLLLVLVLLLSACSDGSGAAPVTPGAESPAAAAQAEKLDHTLITFSGSDVEIRGGGARDEGGVVTISAAGTYEVSGESGGKALVVNTGDDPMDVTLILNNASISNPTGPAIHVKQAKHFRLRLAEGSENLLASGTEADLQNPDPEASGAALFSEDDMDIEGEGSLTVCGYLNNGIGCKNDLDINSGSIAVVAANNGVRGNDSVQIKGGTLAVSAWGDGIKATASDKEGKGYVEISGGSVSLETWGDGVQAATELRVSGGSLTVTTRGDGAEHSSKALKAEKLIQISDGTLSLSTLEDGLRCSAGNVDISGGSLQIAALGDGILAGEKNSGLGDVSVSGGELFISAGSQAIKARGSFSLSGGSLRALCGSEKQVAPQGSPCLLCLISGAQGDPVQLGELGSVEAPQNYKCLLLVLPELSPGQTVTVSNRVGSVDATVK